MRLRFAKSSRLLRHSDFERVYRQGRRYSLPDLAVFYLSPSKGPGQNEVDAQPGSRPVIRVGFTVPRSLGGAVERNRIKRRMREAVRLSLPGISLGESADVVMNPRSSVGEMPFENLLRQVREAFRAIELRKGSARSIQGEAKRGPTGKK